MFRGVWSGIDLCRSPSLLAAVPSSFGFRFIKLLDSVLHHLVPAWDHTVGTFSKLKVSSWLYVLLGPQSGRMMVLALWQGRQLEGNTCLSSGH